jgi:hypothetical protein
MDVQEIPNKETEEKISRGIWLTIWLAFLFLANVYLTYQGFVIPDLVPIPGYMIIVGVTQIFFW